MSHFLGSLLFKGSQSSLKLRAHQASAVIPFESIDASVNADGDAAADAWCARSFKVSIANFGLSFRISFLVKG